MPPSPLPIDVKAIVLDQGLSYELASTLYKEAFDYFGSERSTANWLTSPCYSLGGRRPLEYAGSIESLEQVLDFLDGLRYGNFA